MDRALREALSLFFSNAGLYAAIVCCFWGPINLASNWAYFTAPEEAEFGVLRLTLIVGSVFDAWVGSAALAATRRLKLGETPTFGQAMRDGFSCWGSMFATRLVVGILVGLGLIALVLPGVFLALRYAFAEAAVVAERVGTERAMKRSVSLTQGMRWRIAGVVVVSLLGVALVALAVYVPLQFLLAVGSPPLIAPVAWQTAADSLLDVACLVPTVAVFLLYWETRIAEAGGPAAPGTRILLRNPRRTENLGFPDGLITAFGSRHGNLTARTGWRSGPVGSADAALLFFESRQVMAEGTIKRLTDKGFGFIDTGSGSDMFFHHSNVVGVAYDDLREGQKVTFESGQGPKGPRAENVQVVD